MLNDHELRYGDCLDAKAGLASLPDGGVASVICDPPYTEHVHNNVLAGNDSASGKWFKARPVKFAALSGEALQALAVQFARVTRRWIVIFSAIEQTSEWRQALVAAGLEYVRTGAWVKPGAPPQFTGDRPGTGFEALVIAHATRKGKPMRKRWNGGGRPGVWTFEIARGKRLHETEKPLDLMEALVRDFSDPGELILDPFAGSCSTGVACKRLGRRFLGWEFDARYHATGEKRLAQAREQMALALAEPGPEAEPEDPRQIGLFG